MARVKNLPKGSKNHQAKLHEDQIHEIKTIYEWLDISYTKLAKFYSVSKASIYHVLHGKTWTHVK